MSEKNKLSLFSAILININIMLGSGIFINTIPLARITGALGALSYLIVGFLLLPLVFSMAKLLKIFPSGSFYTFGANAFHPSIGFLSTWCYFIGKLSSATLAIHFFVLIAQGIIPTLKIVSPFVLDVIIIGIFTILNLLNLRAGSKIQNVFIGMKMIPVTFVILVGLFLANPGYITSKHLIWSGLPASFPFIIYAFAGFEASCSLSKHIENSEKNAPRAILISYGLVISFVFLYQLFFYLIMGPKLAFAGHYFEAFPMLLKNIFTNDILRNKLEAIFQLAIGSSALGASYGILYSNSWNLFALVERKLVFNSKKLSNFNKYDIPYYCVAIEAFFCLFYLTVTKGNNIPLQQMGALGATIAYFISSISLLYIVFKTNHRKRSLFWPTIASISSLVLLITCIYSFTSKSLSIFFVFLSLILIGLTMFKIKHKNAAITETLT